MCFRDLESSAKIIEELKLTSQHGIKQKGGGTLEKSLIEVRAQLYKVMKQLFVTSNPNSCALI